MSNGAYWMVHNIGQGVPKKMHPTRESATTEAKRLSALYPGMLVVVLEAVDAFVVEAPPVDEQGKP